MSPIVTITKLLPPTPRPILLSRPRLLDCVERLFTDYHALLVTAPPGYGKTSLLTELVATRKYPVCWYSLEASDQNMTTFLAHLITAIELTFPGFHARLSLASPTTLAEANLVVGQFVNALHDHIHQPFLLMLEDFQHIAPNPILCHFVSQFIKKVDDHCRLMIASRVLPAFSDLPLMVARHQIGQVTMQELAFQPDEVLTLLRQNYGLILSKAEVHALTQKWEGWITGLLLTLDPLTAQGGVPATLLAPTGMNLDDYFTQQALELQEPWVRERLLWTSLMAEFDAPLCQDVLGECPQEGSWEHFVNQCRSQNLFVMPSQSQPERLRYHPLFRTFLQSRLWQEQPTRALQLTEKLAAYHENLGDWNQAHEFYERLGPQPLIAFLERAGSALLRTGAFSLLKTWLEMLPADLIQQPALLSLRGALAVMEGNPKRGLLLLERAAVRSRESGALGILARTLVRSAVARIFLGEYRGALADADEALILLAQTPDSTALYAEALRSRGLSLAHLGQNRLAQDWLERALALYESLQEEQNVAILHADLGMVQMKLGHYLAVLHHHTSALEYWQQAGNVVWQANLLNNFGVLYHVQGDYLQANQCLEAGLAYAIQGKYVRLEAFVWCSLGDLYTDLGAYQAAGHAYMRARQGVGQVGEQFLLLALRVSHARWLRQQGLITLASHTLAMAHTLVESNGSLLERGLYYREAGLIALAAYHTTGTPQNLQQAKSHLEQALTCFTEDGQLADIPGIHLSLAAVYHHTGQHASCHTALTLAFALGSELESPQPLVSAAREVKPFLGEAKSWGMVGGYGTLLLQQVEAWEQRLPSIRRQIRPHVSSVPFPPPHLSFHALGDEHVRVDGVSVSHATWRFLKAQDLLFCLLAHPRGLTKEQVGLLFWPDCSPTQLKHNFKVIIHRLRRVLGQEVILQEDGVYRFNTALDYESDVEQFKNHLAQAHAATQPTMQLAAYGRAIASYQGSYLPNIEEEWALLEREQLRLAYLRALWRVAKTAHTLGDDEEALTACQQLLSEEPCHEAAHRFLMRLYAARGQQAEVVRQFTRCQQALRQELALSPSVKTTALLTRLVRSLP